MKKTGKIIGIIMRGVSLGVLLFFAIMILIGTNSDMLIFRYQGF